MSSPPHGRDGFGWIGSSPPVAPAERPPETGHPEPAAEWRVSPNPGSWGGNYHSSPNGPATPARRRGILGTIVAGALAVFKGGFLLLKLGAFKGTLITMVISVVVYSLFFGPIFAIGFVLLLLVHEMGHYLMAKRLGQSVSAPVFVPFLGALINMRRQPASVQQEATMALAGPVVGTAAAWLCVLVGITQHSEFWAALGYLGCLLNLFNLIPATPLDGGRVTAAISKWANLVGLGILVLYAVWAFTSGTAVSPVIAIIVLFAVFGTISRFRQARRMPEYLAVPLRERWLFLGAYLLIVLIAALGVVKGYPYLQYVHTVHLHLPFSF
ncbi:MAG TPA: site-2 protease family protein [Candidatus Acidoferrales bacterium]|nr:site-2 protease family protein [Candidatus Acidoferrales bacterium]